MPVGRLILLGLLGLVVAETAVFLTFAWAFGISAALAVQVATSALGMVVLARMGMRLAGRVADILSRQDFGAAGTRSSGFLTTAGALLLILPGFISDCAGLLLMIPAMQRRLIERAPVGRSQSARRVLDLDRSQWRDLPDQHIAGPRDKPQKVPPKRRPRR
jgi:UPF0716 protein FxsA